AAAQQGRLALGRLTRRPAHLRGGAAASVVDQIVSSASNFLVLALVARATGPESYALFAGALAVYLFALGVQRALVVEPMVLMAGRDPFWAVAQSRRASRRVASGAAVVLAVAASVATVLGASPQLNLTVGVLVVTVPALLAQDLARWRFLALRRANEALRNDVIFAVGELSLIFALLMLDLVNVPAALLAVAAGGVAASVDGARRLPTPPPQGASFAGAAAAPRVKGWLLVDFVCTWLNGQAALFIVVAVATSREAGVFRAVNDLFGPLRVIQLSLLTVLLPTGAAAFAGGQGAALRRTVRRAAVPAVAVSVAFCLVAAAVGPQVLVAVFGAEFRTGRGIVFVLAVVSLLVTVQVPFIAGLKAAYEARILALARVATTLPTLALLIVGTAAAGLRGAAVALLVATVLRVAVFAVLFARRTRAAPGGRSAGAATRDTLPE
ncbi:MAG: hypothetical protein M3353_02960, partial [Actinomycetota bacterium]|nr:hypothetical protein [Actinomycetota bacterium]